MSERAPVLAAQGGERGSGPGARLQAARTARAIDVAAVATSLRVTPRIIEALEADRYEVFDAPVYARGFLRTYARFLGLEPDELLDAYDALAGEQAPPTLIPPTTARPLPRDYSVLKGIGVFVLALALVGVSFWWWMSRTVATPEAPSPAPVAAPATQPPLANVTPDTDTELPLPPPDAGSFNGAPEEVAPAAPAAAPTAAPAGQHAAPAAVPTKAAPAPSASPPAAKGAAAPAVVPASAPQQATAASAPAVQPPPARVAAAQPAIAAMASPAPVAGGPSAPKIVLHGKSDCWVEVRGAGGARLFYDLVRAGQTRTIDAPGPWFVFLGYAAGVEVSVGGRVVDVPDSRRDGAKARFGLNADGTVR